MGVNPSSLLLQILLIRLHLVIDPFSLPPRRPPLHCANTITYTFLLSSTYLHYYVPTMTQIQDPSPVLHGLLETLGLLSFTSCRQHRPYAYRERSGLEKAIQFLFFGFPHGPRPHWTDKPTNFPKCCPISPLWPHPLHTHPSRTELCCQCYRVRSHRK